MKSQSVTAEPPIESHSSLFSLDPCKVYSSIADVVLAIDGNGIFQFVSPSCLELFGYGQAEMMGQSIFRYMHPDDADKRMPFHTGQMERCRTAHFENRLLRKDGSVIPVLWSCRWEDQDQMFYCTVQDGSEKFAIEQRLLKAQQLAKVANFEFDIVRNNYTYTSDTLFDIFGVDRSKHPVFTTDLFWGLVHPDDMSFVRASVHLPDHLVSSTLEYRIIRPDGKVIYINRVREVIRDACGKPVKTIGTIQDITDRKLGELALQQREERFRSLVQNGNDLLGIVDPKGNYSFVSENVIDHLGFRAEELLGSNSFALIHPEDASWVVAAAQAIYRKPLLTICPYRFQNSKGEWRWLETTVSNHLDNPAIAGLVINSRDVTERKQKEEERRQYEDELRKLSLIAKETINAVILQDSQRKVLWVNQAFISLTGYQLEECIGKTASEICDGPDTDPATIRYVQERDQRKEAFRIEVLNYKKNGETYWADVCCQPVFNLGGEVVQYFSIATDVTERKRLLEQLERERHEQQVNIAAATLKAQEHERTIVSQELHDNVNQVLTTVKLYTEMCRDGIGNPKEVMNKSIQLLQETINEIRSLSKRLSAPSLGKIRLTESVKELVDAVAATNKFTLKLDTSSIEQLEVEQDIHLAIFRILQEHLTNILKHAAATTVVVSLDYIMGSIQLRVNDDGIGFNPKQKSSGIGIANMVTRAQSLGGKLVISSAANKGCELKVTIPI